MCPSHKAGACRLSYVPALGRPLPLGRRGPRTLYLLPQGQADSWQKSSPLNLPRGSSGGTPQQGVWCGEQSRVAARGSY
jgi:hypothetical protein